MNFDGDRDGVGGGSNGEMGHIRGGETDSGRCRTDVRGTMGVEMSPEDGCIQESVGNPEQNHDGLI